MTYLLDTNVISELRKRKPDPNVAAWYAGVAEDEVFLSVVSIGEIRRGIEILRRKDGPQAESLERWLAGLLHVFQGHIAIIDPPVAEAWGRLNVPNPLPVLDGLLAATAQVHGWTVVTRNTADMPTGSVHVLNPFLAAT